MKRVRLLVAAAAASIALVAAAAPAHAVSLSDCYAGGGSIGVGSGYFFCDGGDFDGEIIG